jgi:large subunit ribosomal protein L5
MYQFMDRLFNVAMPRIRDFRGVAADSFDHAGNYNMGLQEQIIFPEIEYDKVRKIQGMNIAFITTAKTQKESYRLLELLGMPFRKK